VHGAAGGVGSAGALLGALAGAEVVATVRDEAKRPAVDALHAAIWAVPQDGFEAHGPFDVVLELVGAPNLPGDVEALATGGRISVIGVGAGAKAEVNLLGLMGKRGRILASTLRARPLEQKADAARRVETEVLPLLEDGRLRVPVDRTFAMADAADAYEHFAGGGKVGKVVLLT
jgi:NADPH:quinone reductase-like Zn-dependent oxidoreductase